MSKPTFSAIVPLIGGLPLGMMNAIGTLPEEVLTYTPFKDNDSHFVHYLRNRKGWRGNYIDLVKEDLKLKKVDIVGTTCPCAGLSSLSPTSSSDAQVNEWMLTTAEDVLSRIQPKVLWGENAPRFAGSMGEPIVERLSKIGLDHGYTMSIYKTKSKLHGLAQVRERSFYFLWKYDELFDGEKKVPIFDYFDEEPNSIECTIRNSKIDGNDYDFHSNPTSVKIPSKDDPFYRFLLEGWKQYGTTPEEFRKNLQKSADTMRLIEDLKISFLDVAEWMRSQGLHKLATRCESIHAKQQTGGNSMMRGSIIGKGIIGAFVGHAPTSLVHPDEDRYITYREALSIMCMPSDFELLEPKKNLNHVCQNVPVGTATDMTNQILKVLEGKAELISGSLIRQFNAGNGKNKFELPRVASTSTESLEEFCQ